MRHAVLSAIFIGHVLFLISIANADINDDLIAYYPLNGTAVDESGNANHGTVSGNVSYVTGIEGSAAHFNGNSSIDLPYTHISDSITFSTWIALEEQLNPGEEGPIFNIYEDDNGGYNLAYICHSGDNQHYITMGVWSGSINNWATYQLPYVLAPDRDYHLAVSYDAIQRAIDIYVDGVLQGTLSDVDPPGGDHWKAGTESHLGRGYGQTPGTCLNGSLDEVRIYDRALSAAEIGELSAQAGSIDLGGGYAVTSEIWLKAVLEVSGSPITLVWKMVGADLTPSGDQVISGYFYADPDDFAYGSVYNPETFVKVYIASNGWCNIMFNHVTVDDVTVSSAHRYAGSPSQTGTAALTNRMVEQQYTGVAIDSALQSTGGLPGSGGASGVTLAADIWAKAVLEVPGSPVSLVWQAVGTDTTPSGDTVVSGYFYANPDDFAYGSLYNPEVFVKMYIATNGWCNIAFNHVTVDPVSVSTAHQYTGTVDQSGTVTLNDRLAEHQYTGVQTDAIDISKFYGQYQVNEFSGPCQWSYVLTIGNDIARIDDDIQGIEYLYLDPSNTSFVYPDGSKTVEISKDSIHVYENDDGEIFDCKYRFSQDYSTISLEGTAVDPMNSSCSGSISGQGTRASGSIVGSWGPGYANGYQSGESDYLSLTIYPNGHYIHWQSDKKDEPDDNGGGVEYGTYTYDPVTQFGTINPIVDENGCIGPSDYGQPTSGYNTVVIGDTLYIGGNAFQRVQSSASLLVGGWGPGYMNSYQSGDSDYASLTFYPNGYYIHWQSDKRDEAGDMGGGVEYGTYTYTPTTGYATVHPIVDENGSIGLSDYGSESAGYITVDENTLSIGGLTLERVQ